MAQETDTTGLSVAHVDATDNPVSGRTWAITLILLCLAIIAYGIFFSENSANNFAFLLGYYSPLALIVWGIFHLAVGRKRGKKSAAIALAAILTAFIASGFAAYTRESIEAKRVVNELKQNQANLIAAGTAADGTPKRIEQTVSTTPTTKGDLGKVERLAKTFMNNIVSQRNDYLLELDAIGWNTILAPERLSKDKQLAESRVMLSKGKAIVEKYKIKTYVLLETTRKDIEQLKVSKDAQDNMLRSYDKGMRIAKPDIEAIWRLEEKAFSYFESIINLLHEKEGQWAVRGGRLLFANEADMNKVNSYLSALEKTVKEQQAIQERSQKRAWVQ